ncbi:hypothetical protein [Amycolatopsis anabasis]|uniref:hypothetical protein n=1 Tax=Amycolatopsis anabasis TaxID=1840409 RepID=UPI00131C9179|nr:hypothetical protein [Amycolatopsis anabasis]
MNAYRIEEGLRALTARGFRFQHIRDDDGHISAVIGSYGWRDCYDRIQIHGENDAVAARATTDSLPGEDVLWSFEGDVLSAIQALLELPRPDEPGAPQLARRGSTALWLP